MYIKEKIYGRAADSLLKTNVESWGDPFIAYADSAYKKKKELEKKRLMDKIDELNNYDFGV